MNSVILDLDHETLDTEYIKRRVKDWKERVDGLYASISGWLPDGWEAQQGPSVEMHEKMMRAFNVGSTRMPTLELQHNEGHVAKFVPFALWVLGTNGRVDFKFNGQRHEIFDMADSFEPPV